VPPMLLARADEVID